MAYRFWIIVALTVLAGWLVWRWYSHRAAGAGRWRTPRFPYLILGLILVLTFFEARWQIREHQANQAVAGIADGGTIRCQRWTEANFFARQYKGFVAYGPDGVPGDEGMLTWDTCRDLFSWMESGKEDPSLDEVIAVHVLTHEAHHLGGLTSELLTECASMGDDARVAEALGAGPGQAAGLAERYRLEVWPRMPSAYRGVCPDTAGNPEPAATG